MRLTRTHLAAAVFVLAIAGGVAGLLLKRSSTPESFVRDLTVMLKHRFDEGKRLAGLNDPRAGSEILKEVDEYRRATQAGASSKVDPEVKLVVSKRIASQVKNLRRLLNENQRAIAEFTEGRGPNKENARNEMKRTSDELEPWTRLLWDYMNAVDDFETVANTWSLGRQYAFLDRVESDARVMAEEAQREIDREGTRPGPPPPVGSDQWLRANGWEAIDIAHIACTRPVGGLGDPWSQDIKQLLDQGHAKAALIIMREGHLEWAHPNSGTWPVAKTLGEVDMWRAPTKFAQEHARKLRERALADEKR